MEYRKLLENEIDLIWNIDRTEYVSSNYIYNDGALIEKKIDKTFYGWPPGEDKIYGPILKECYRRGGYFFGGFISGELKAIVVLDTEWIGEDKDTLQLKFLHIDRQYRKQGIGKFLFTEAINKAIELKAKRVYVSSCENKNTVEFYKHMGCILSGELEPDLYELEPNDIHMEYII